MIKVELNGRLGNQLFQYAFAIALSKKFKTFYLIDKKQNTDQIYKYFKKNKFLYNPISQKILNIIYKEKKISHQSGSDSIENIVENIQNHTTYKGFYQSEKYFLNFENEIKKHLIIKDQYVKSFKLKYQSLIETSYIAVHFRLGDYLTWGSESLGGENLALPASFYRKAIAIATKNSKSPIILITDDPQNLSYHFPEAKNYKIINDTEINDFQMLLNAEKLIISNSTFAWWAAYLNNKESKMVYAPKFWLGFKINQEYPLGITSAKFDYISVIE